MSVETLPKSSSTRDERGYTITSTGNVVVDVDRLLKSPRAQEIARKAKSIVQKNDRSAR